MSKSTAAQDFTELVVGQDVAKLNFDNWLKSRRIRPIKREQLAENEERIIEEIMYGVVEIGDDGQGGLMIKQNMLDPIKNDKDEIAHDSIVFKGRMLVRQVQGAFNSAKTDVDKNIELLARVTSLNSAEIVKKMNYTDYEVSIAILMYFL